MSTALAPHPVRKLTRFVWPLVVLLAGLALTLGGWYRYRQEYDARAHAHFDRRSLATVKLIQVRLGYYEQALLGARGLFAAGGAVGSKEFAAYVASLQVDESYPGIQGIGFAQIVPASEKERHLALVRSQGFPEYQMHPDQNQAIYSTIIYLEPFKRRNLRAFGYDMLTEPTRHEAMSRARDEDRISLSGKVKLVQETDTDIQAGVLVYVPVYANGQAALTVAERRQRLLGWVYAPLRMNDLMNGLLRASEVDLALRIFDGPGTDNAALLFEEGYPLTTGTGTVMKAQHSLSFGDRTWTVVTQPLPALMVGLGLDRSMMILIGGALGSLLLATYTLFLMRQFYDLRSTNATLRLRGEERDRAQETVLEGELHYQTLSNSGEALIWTSGTDKLCNYFNEPWLAFTGRTLQQELGNGWAEGVHPEDLARCLDIYLKAFDHHESFSMDYRLRHASGDYRWILEKGTPRHDSKGTFLGYIGHCLDITRSVADAEQLQLQMTELQLRGEGLRRSWIELEAERARYYNLYDLAPVGYCTLNEQGLILESNLSVAVLLGMRRKDLINRPLSEFILEEDRVIYFQHHEQALKTSLAAAWEQRMVDRHGTEFWAQCTATAALGADDSPGLRFVLSDITQRKLAELALQEREEQYRVLTNAAPDAIVTCDRTGRIVNWNRSAEVIFGYSEAEILGEPLLRLIPERFHAAHQAGMERIRTGGELRVIGRTVELIGQHKDGRELALELSLSRWETSSGWFITGIVRDIGERQRLLDVLRKSEESFRILVDTAQELIWKCDTEGRFTDLNPSWERTHGYPVEEMLGRSFGDFQHPEAFQRDVQEFSRHLAGGFVRGYETTHLAKSGQELTLLFNASPMLDEAGRIVGTQGTATDISHRQRAMEQERLMVDHQHQSEKMDSLGTLASGVAHDMNNVLAAILGLASAHITSQPEGSPAHHAFEVISDAAVRGGKLVRSLLNFARKTPLEVLPLDLNQILREEVQLLLHTTLAKVHVELDLAPDLRLIRGDATALTHAFMNLCINAVEAMPEEGRLTLRTRNADNHWIEVRVEDSGSGMTKEVLQKARDPFFTTKASGTGLGLALVHSSVKAHRGQLELISEPGQGTCVRLRFPACEPTSGFPGQGPEATDKTPSRSLSVLVVDDDVMATGAFAELLQALHHSHRIAASGEGALALLHEGFQPDVVLLDINMPGLGGTGTLPRLRALRPTLPVLLITGRADQEAIDLAATQPGVTLVAKPFGLVELQQHLASIGRTSATLQSPPLDLEGPGDSGRSAEAAQDAQALDPNEPHAIGAGLQRPFTVAGVEAWEIPGTFDDGGGLYLQVALRKPPMKGVSKSWVFRYRDLVTGRPREMGLGAAWDLSLEDARKSARAQQALLGAHLDPMATRNAQRAEAKTALK